MPCIRYIHNDPLDPLSKIVSGTTCEGQVGLVSLNFGESVCMDATKPIVICYGLTITYECLGPDPTPTPTITPTMTQTIPPVTPSPTETLPPVTPSPTETLPPVTPSPTQTIPPVTPSPTSTPLNEIYISTVRNDCSDFCTTNYTITVLRLATNNFSGIGPGDTISGITQDGFYAISNVSTDTDTGPFKIVETDDSGLVLSVLICVGSSCEPL